MSEKEIGEKRELNCEKCCGLALTTTHIKIAEFYPIAYKPLGEKKKIQHPSQGVWVCLKCDDWKIVPE